MIAYVSKLPLDNVNRKEFHAVVAYCHALGPLSNQIITNLDNGYILQDEDIVAYHIEDGSIYDYIFKESTQEVYICFDRRENKRFDLLYYLFAWDFIGMDGEYDVQYLPHEVEHCVLPPVNYLPFVCFPKNTNSVIVEECAGLLEGRAHVLCGDVQLDEETLERYQVSKDDHFAILNHRNCLRFTQSKNETNEEYAKRIFYKVQTYMSNRVYESTFNMKELYQTILLKANQQNDEKRLEEYEGALSDLDLEKQEMIERIESFEQKVEALQNQVDYLKARIEAESKYPLLLKGKIEEKYEGEQKDVILAILQSFLAHDDNSVKSLVHNILEEVSDEEKVEMIHEILEENPEVGKRRVMLDEILRVLKSSKEYTERETNQLEKVGLKCYKGNNHYTVKFFDDSQYHTTMGVTNSDSNACLEIYNTMEKLFF